MQLEILFLREIHHRADCAKAKAAKGEQQQSLMEAAEGAGKIMSPLRFGGIHVRNQGKHPQHKQQRRGKCANEPEPLPRPHDEVTGHNGPHNECCSFIEIVDRAGVEVESPLGHGDRVQDQATGQHAVHHPVIPPEPFPPQKHGIHHRNAVQSHRAAKKIFIRPVQGSGDLCHTIAFYAMQMELDNSRLCGRLMSG